MTMNQNRPNFAGGMILDDHLKKVLARTGCKPFKMTDNKLLPRSQHSAFGDFPATHMPKKDTLVIEPLSTVAAEQSVANTKVSKYNSHRLRPQGFLEMLESADLKEAWVK
jgi:hypothetical protein